MLTKVLEHGGNPDGRQALTDSPRYLVTSRVVSTSGKHFVKYSKYKTYVYKSS